MRAPSGELTFLYYDDEGLLYALQRGASRYYVATDQVGSPRVVTDAAGTVVKTVAYDSFGNVTADSAPGFELPFGFAGGLADPVTGLVRFGFRDYEPETGRWTARDPILFEGGQANLYVYAGGDPVGRATRPAWSASAARSTRASAAAGRCASPTRVCRCAPRPASASGPTSTSTRPATSPTAARRRSPR